ncbi:SLAM family member 5 isoform 1-T1 [Molossus nigricans]
MAQRYLWILLLFLQTCLEAAEKDTDILTVNGILGESVIFPLEVSKLQQVENIAWTNSKTSVALVIPVPGKGPIVTVTHQNYYQRISAPHQIYSLEISNLKMEDAGIYKADININVSQKMSTITRSYNLQVYSRLGKPKITQSLVASVNDTCNVTLTCSVEKERENVTYTWSPLGKQGSVLQISQTPKNKTLTYTCTAWNPVSNSSDSISSQHLCADITTGFHIHHPRLLSVLVLLFLLVFILLPVLLFILWKRRKGSYVKTFSKKPDAVSKNTIYTYATIPRGARPAEPRIYDEISSSKVPSTKEKPVDPIYSILQYSDKMEQSTQDSRPPGTSTYERVI